LARYKHIRPPAVYLTTLLKQHGSRAAVARALKIPYPTVARWYQQVVAGTYDPAGYKSPPKRLKAIADARKKARAEAAPGPTPAADEPHPELPDLSDPTAVRAFLLGRFASQARGFDSASVQAAKALASMTGADAPELRGDNETGGLSPQDARYLRGVRRRMAQWYRAAIQRHLGRLKAYTDGMDEARDADRVGPDAPADIARLERLQELYLGAANARTGQSARIELAQELRTWGADLFR
jgi:hypothetical protein